MPGSVLLAFCKIALELHYDCTMIAQIDCCSHAIAMCGSVHTDAQIDSVREHAQERDGKQCDGRPELRRGFAKVEVHAAAW